MDGSGPTESCAAGDPAEVPLVGDGVTEGIVRVGDTVRRPLRPFSSTVRAYLAHLHRAGFTDAPVPLGVDERGREVLSFVAGEVPRQPLPPECAGDDVLVAMAQLVRRLADAAEGWVVPADAVWGVLPAAGPPDAAGSELVGHCDYCPGNVVFRDGVPAALIDFDLAKPTTRIAEVANALYWWAPLLDPADRAPAFVDLDVADRVATFADGYRLDAIRRAALVPFLQVRARRAHVWARAAAEVDPLFRRFWADGLRERMPRAEAWVDREAGAIAHRLTGGRAPR